MNPPPEQPTEAAPLEYFLLGRRIRHGLSECGRNAAARGDGDVFYLWLQTESIDDEAALTEDQWLNIVDEASTLGVNWLVVTLGKPDGDRDQVARLCRWAQATHGMVVCLHTRYAELSPAEHNLLVELPRESTFLLVEPEHLAAFAELADGGVNVGSANPASESSDRESCEYPHRMIFVDARGRLYTCGLVSGEHDFFLGSVLDGDLNAIIHNPQLPHSVSVTDPGAHTRCSGCPPLVAQHLCPR